MRAGYRKSSKGNIIACLIIGTLIIGGYIFAYNYFDKHAEVENEVILTDTTFQVKGFFGTAYRYEDVISVELRDDLPNIITKYKGLALGDVKKGEFNLEELGDSRLNVLTKDGPYIIIKFERMHLVIDHLDKNLTYQLYTELLERINK